MKLAHFQGKAESFGI